MKVFNIDYRAADGTPTTIARLMGFNSEDDATKAPLSEGAIRLQARGPADLSSLGDSILAALWEFKAKKGAEVPADGITADTVWAMLVPAKKPAEPFQRLSPEDEAKMIASNKRPPYMASKDFKAARQALKAAKTDLTPGATDDKTASSEAATNGDAPANGGKNMSAKKKAAKKKVAKKKTAAKKKAAAAPKASKAKSGEPRGEKMKKLAAKLDSVNGCTRKWVQEVIGWPTISFQQIAKNLGRKLKKEKEKGKPAVYFAPAPAVKAA